MYNAEISIQVQNILYDAKSGFRQTATSVMCECRSQTLGAKVNRRIGQTHNTGVKSLLVKFLTLCLIL